MTTVYYDMNLIKRLREQMAYLHQYNKQFRADVEREYQQFLDYIDQKSEAAVNTDAHEYLKMIYAYVAARMEEMQEVLVAEDDNILALGKELDRIEAENDTAFWHELAADLFADGLYNADTAVFLRAVERETTELKDEVRRLLADWKSCVEEGSVAELASLLQALEEEEDDFNSEEGDDDDCCDDEDGEKGRSCCASSDEDDEDEEGCCGRQKPCCRESDCEDDAECND